MTRSRGTAWELELQSTLGHALMFTERNSKQAESALRRGLEIAEGLDDLSNKFRLLARLNMFYRRTGEYRHLLPVALEAEKVARVIGDHGGARRRQGACRGFLPPCRQPVRKRRSIWMKACRAMQRCAAPSPGILPMPERRRFRSRGCLWLRGFPDRAIECVRPLDGRRCAARRRDALHRAVLVRRRCSDGSATGPRSSRWPVGSRDACRHSRTGALSGRRRRVSRADHDCARRAEGRRRTVAVVAAAPACGSLRALRIRLCRGAVARAGGAGPVAGRRCKVLHETIARVEPEGAAFDMPELLRLRGELEARSGDLEAAEASFAASIALAEQQGALSWRLRTEMSLARLRRQQGVGHALARRLAETYARFSEGFETADLKAARLMLDETSSR